MILTKRQPDTAIVLHPRVRGSAWAARLDLEEAVDLAKALEVEVVNSGVAQVKDIHPAQFFGGGKIAEIRDEVQNHAVSMVVVNADINPIQQRNLEKQWNAKVVDRTGLILEIFGLRAATKEGRLQVELARLAYERSRLVRTWTHLERQRGGQGFLSGPGETQIEADRRILDGRMTRLRRDLEHVRRTRGLQRQKRKRSSQRIVALVGYTNAGKSTLFNKLTGGGVPTGDMLFATLHATHRIMALPSGKTAVLSDTVGFISDLPTELITSFRATLEEVKMADLLIHVRDISDPQTERRWQDVSVILGQLNAGPEHNQEIIDVWNKADALGDEAISVLERRAVKSRFSSDMTSAYIISALTGDGLDELMVGIEMALSVQDEIFHVRIEPGDHQIRAWLHENGQVLSETMDNSGICEMDVQLTNAGSGKLRSRYPGVFAY
ncbi:MAG: GTPase HflX [Hyphomonadaceae bacterium]|nr:GTPase HflX [Hyphomonadaceae bacterium]